MIFSRKKLKNIVVKFSSVDLIMSFLSNQRQYTEVNANTSEIINNENIGVFQGSSLSGILYLIYNLDINLVTHFKKHKNNLSERKCLKTKNCSYVDDIYGSVVSTKDSLWSDIINYINNLNVYFK